MPAASGIEGRNSEMPITSQNKQHRSQLGLLAQEVERPRSRNAKVAGSIPSRGQVERSTCPDDTRKKNQTPEIYSICSTLPPFSILLSRIKNSKSLSLYDYLVIFDLSILIVDVVRVLRITRAWAVNLSVNTFYIQQGRRKRGGGGA